jgi:hypothetical protein
MQVVIYALWIWTGLAVLYMICLIIHLWRE